MAPTRLVDLLHQHKSAREAFKEGADKVSSWVFLPCTSQLLAGAEADEGEVVIPLLERLAADYPQAIYFPFRVGGESGRVN